MAKKEQLKIDEFAGWQLTNAAFVQYMDSAVKAMLAVETDKIDVDKLTTDIWASVQQMTALINKEQAFEETKAVATADEARDRTMTFIYWTIHYANLLPTTSYYYQAAHKLWVKAQPYKSIARHELMKETREIDGFYRDVQDADSKEAIKTLGLERAFNELHNANIEVKNEIMTREQERGARKEAVGGVTAKQLRREILSEWQEVAFKVSAAYGYTEDAKLKEAITNVNGVVAHYRLVAANMGKKQQKDEPQPDDTAAGGQTDAAE